MDNFTVQVCPQCNSKKFIKEKNAKNNNPHNNDNTSHGILFNKLASITVISFSSLDFD